MTQRIGNQEAQDFIFGKRQSSSSSANASRSRNEGVGSGLPNAGVGIGGGRTNLQNQQFIDFSILENEQSITVNWVDKILTEAFRSNNSSKKLMDNIKVYERMIELKGLQPIKEDLKDIKAKTEKDLVPIESLFGPAGLAFDHLLRNLTWIVMFQDLAGIFPPLTWEGTPLNLPIGEYNDKELKSLLAESIVDFMCGNTNSSEGGAGALFRGVCDVNTARAAVHMFLMFKRTTVEEHKLKCGEVIREVVADSVQVSSRKLHLRSIVHKIRSSYMEGVDDDGNEIISTCVHTTHDTNYLDKDTVYGRLWTSFNTKLKGWFYRLVTILRRGEGYGYHARGGLLGIEEHNRAMILGNTHHNGGNGFREDKGPLARHISTGKNYDPLVPLPRFSKWHLDEMIKGNNISPIQTKVESDMVIYCEKSPSTWVSTIDGLLESKFQAAQLEDPSLLRPEGGVLPFEDLITPSTYYLRAIETQQNLHHFYASIKLTNDLMKSFGIGPILSSNHNNSYPFQISYAALSAFENEDDHDTNTSKIVVSKVADINKNDENVIGDFNSNLLVDIEKYGMRNSIPGGILFDFICLLQKSIMYQEYLDMIEGHPDFDVESVLSGERKNKLEQLVSIGLATNILVTGRDTDESMSQKSILLRSPFITLLHMITWNQYGCCPTLTDMDTFEDFFKVYTSEFLGRITALLQSCIQFPEHTYNVLNDLEPNYGKSILSNLFGEKMIGPEIAVAHLALWESDKRYAMEIMPLSYQQFVLIVANALAPNAECLLPNFGRVTRQSSKDPSNKSGGLLGSIGGKQVIKLRTGSIKKIIHSSNVLSSNVVHKVSTGVIGGGEGTGRNRGGVVGNQMSGNNNNNRGNNRDGNDDEDVDGEDNLEPDDGEEEEQDEDDLLEDDDNAQGLTSTSGRLTKSKGKTPLPSTSSSTSAKGKGNQAMMNRVIESQRQELAAAKKDGAKKGKQGAAALQTSSTSSSSSSNQPPLGTAAAAKRGRPAKVATTNKGGGAGGGGDVTGKKIVGTKRQTTKGKAKAGNKKGRGNDVLNALDIVVEGLEDEEGHDDNEVENDEEDEDEIDDEETGEKEAEEDNEDGEED